MPDGPSNPRPSPQPRSVTIIAAGLLLAALALVILYTSRAAFLSPIALVVVAAIGVAALLLQLRLRPDLSSLRASNQGPLWLNALGVICALAALFADILHLNEAFTLIAALAAVVSFAIGGIIVLNALRKYRSSNTEPSSGLPAACLYPRFAFSYLDWNWHKRKRRPDGAKAGSRTPRAGSREPNADYGLNSTATVVSTTTGWPSTR